MSTASNSRNRLKRAFGLVMLLICLMSLVILPSSSGRRTPSNFINKALCKADTPGGLPFRCDSRRKHHAQYGDQNRGGSERSTPTVPTHKQRLEVDLAGQKRRDESGGLSERWILWRRSI